MDSPPVGLISTVESVAGGPSSNSRGEDNEVRHGATVCNAGLAEILSSATLNLRGPLVANEIPAESFPVTSVETLRQRIAGAGSVVVGLEALNWAGNFQQSRPAGQIEAGEEGEPNARGGGFVVGISALNSTDDDFQRGEPAVVPVGLARQGEPNAEGRNVSVRISDLNSIIDLTGEEEPEVPVGVARQGGPNPGGGSVAVVIPDLIRINDFQRERAGPVEGARRGDGNAGGTNVVVQPHGPNNVDDFRLEVAVPVKARKDRRRSLEEAAGQLASGSLSQERGADDVDSLGCPICLESWTNTGDHRVCSLACGHLFGESCISRWLRQGRRKTARCPQCNKRAKVEDVRTLYVPRILAVVDAEDQKLGKEIRALREENLRVKLENRKLREEVRLIKGKPEFTESAALRPLAGNSARIPLDDPVNITGGSDPLESGRFGVVEPPIYELHSGRAFDSRTILSAMPSGRQDHLHTEGGSDVAGIQSSSSRAGGFRHRLHVEEGSGAGPRSSLSRAGVFQLQNEVRVQGGKVFDMDAESLTVIFSNKIEGSGNKSGLSKMSLLSCTEIQRIHLPPDFGGIRDIRLSPSGVGGTGKCALVASTGKKLSLLSLQSNNIVLSYSVQSPPWSCVWDPSAPNLFYSGLQNGALLLVDLRQTSSPVAMLNGPSVRPLHTLQVVQGQFPVHQTTFGRPPPGGRDILSASNSGISLWHLDSSFAGGEIARPQCVYSERDIVCVSLAYECAINSAVASLKGSAGAQAESSQPSSFNEGLSNRRLSQRPNSWEEPYHCLFSRRRESSWSHSGGTVRASEFRLPWERLGEMVGSKSLSLMSRTAIVPLSPSTPQSKSLFACGDDGTNSVWLWDMTSCRLIDTLVPHQSPILDVKYIQIEGKDVLGCVSEEIFQLYKSTSLSE